jgi:dihydroflavonol-4-reductase
MVPIEGVRMAQHSMHIDDSRARAELGHVPTPVAAALERAVTWFRDHGYA